MPEARITVSAPSPAARSMISGGVQSGLQESCTRPGAVAQIDEHQSAEIPPPVHPAAQTHLAADVGPGQGAGEVGPQHGGARRAALDHGLTRFGVDEEAVELIRGLGLDQLLTDGVPPHQPGDATQDLDVQAGRRLRPNDEEEQSDRVAVDGVIGDRLRGHAADHAELLHRGAPRVGDGDTESDAGAEDRLTFLDRRPAPAPVAASARTRWRTSSAIVPCLSRAASGTTSRSGVSSSVSSTGRNRKAWDKRNRRSEVGQCEIHLRFSYLSPMTGDTSSIFHPRPRGTASPPGPASAGSLGTGSSNWCGGCGLPR